MKYGTALVLGLMLTTVGSALAGTEADARRTLKVKLALLDHLRADGMDIGVVASGGDVQLLGTVPNPEAKRLASTFARSVAGVDGVRNRVRVVDAATLLGRRDPRVLDAKVDDAILANQVRLALIEKLGADGIGIGVAAAGGNVTLSFRSGLVAAARLQALEAVRGMAEVALVDPAGGS